MRLLQTLLLLSSLGSLAFAQDVPARLDLSHSPGDDVIAQLLWARSPDLVAARAKMATAQSDVVRSGLWPNPSLDASWNTIPVGRTNPPNLSDSLNRVPNYAFSLSTLVEIAKRGPRQRAAHSAFDAALFDAYELLRQRYYDLNERIADVAVAQVRISAIGDLVNDAHALSQLQHERANRGDTPGLDADRAALEEEKYTANLSDERQKLAEALLECSHVAGVPCSPFADADQASAFLTTGVPVPEGDPDQRPDLRSLAAQQDSARASLELAHNRRIPDPTFRVGYVYDQFTISGNQRNSIFAGVSVPLPVFDHGQADALQAVASADAAGRARELLRTQAERDASALEAQASDLAARRRTLADTSLPLARRLVETLEKVVRQGGTSQTELLLARRGLGELLLDSADVQLQSFHVAAALARNGPTGPPPPPDLAPAL
jgi:cobalt-zinc-cadmium efflux system outer membrane protein